PAVALALGAFSPYNYDYRAAFRRRQAKLGILGEVSPTFTRRTAPFHGTFMATPRVLILRAPGANCDAEAQFAFERAGAVAERVHINRLRESPSELQRYQVLVVPGGFTYGDDVAAGKILGNQLAHFLGDTLRRFRDADKLLLGICNGFQALLK